MREAHTENPRDAWVQNRLIVAYQHLTTLLELADPAEAAARYREALSLMPRLQATIESPYRDVARGALYAGFARFEATPPCDVLAQADEHLTAADERRLLDPGLRQRADWVRAARVKCGDSGMR